MYDPLSGPDHYELLFLCIATPTAIVVQYAITEGNWSEVLEPLLKEAKPEQKITIRYSDDYDIHYINREGVIVAAVADTGFSRQLAFTCLREVEEYAKAEFTDTAVEEAKMFLAQKAGFYNANQDVDKIAKLHKQIEDVNSIVLLNISKALSRSERAELLISRSKVIKSKAQAFKLQSKTVKHFMYVRKNPKQVILIISIVVIALVVGLALYCEDETWHQCFVGMA